MGDQVLPGNQKKGGSVSSKRVKLGKAEEYAWYGYDAMTSLYYGVAGSAFLPILILYSARDFICPQNPSYYYQRYAVYFNNEINFQNLSTPCVANLSWCDDKSSNMADLDASGQRYMAPYCASVVQWMNATGNTSFVNTSNPFILNCTYSNDQYKNAHIFNVANQSGTNTYDVTQLGPTIPHNTHRVKFPYCLKQLSAFSSRTSWGPDEEKVWSECKASTAPELPSEQNGKKLKCWAIASPWTTGPADREVHPSPIVDVINNASLYCSLSSSKENFGEVTFNNSDWRHGTQSITIHIGYDESTNSIANNTFTYRVYPNGDCKNRIPFGFVALPDVSYTTFQSSMGVSGQIIIFIIVSSFGDFEDYRKKVLIFWALVATFANFLIALFPSSRFYWIFSCCYITITMTLGGSVVMYNSYLPWLVKDHPKVRELVAKKTKASDILDEYKRIQESMSTWGFFWGYVSAVFGNCVAMGAIFMWTGDPPKIFNYIIGFCGMWMLGFTLWFAYSVHPRPGPKIPGTGGIGTLVYISMSRLYTSFVSAYMLPESFKFMVAYFLYSDGYATFTNVGVIIAQTLFDVSATELGIMATLMPLGGAIGMHTLLKVQRYLGISAKTMLLSELCYFLILALYTCSGFIKGWDFGMQQKFELYIFCIMLGICLGSIQSYSRTTFIHVIPPGQESEFFGLYEITDKGSSWLGPMIVGVVYAATFEMRFAVFYIFAILFIAFFVLLSVDFVKAKKDCNSLRMAMRIKRIKNARNALTAKKGNRSFLSLGASTISSGFKKAASGFRSSAASSAMSSITSESSTAESSVVSSNASSFVESAMSEIENMDDDEINDLQQAVDEGLEEVDLTDARKIDTAYMKNLEDMKKKLDERKAAMGKKSKDSKET